MYHLLILLDYFQENNGNIPYNNLRMLQTEIPLVNEEMHDKNDDNILEGAIDAIEKAEMDADEVKPTDEWNYEKSHSILSQLNSVFFWCANKLTKYAAEEKRLLAKFTDCNTKPSSFQSGLNAMHDKKKLQQQVDNLAKENNLLKRGISKYRDRIEVKKKSIRALKEKCKKV